MNVSIEQVSVAFGEIDALDHVSLGLLSGEVSVLAGPNGAGKSTLLGVLIGLLAPGTGRVLVDGREAIVSGRRSPLWLREQVGYLPEAVAFSENLSGRQVMRFFARARGVSFQDVEETLELVGLSRPASARVGTYSRGMKQRLGLGVALLAKPDLLVLDEPTGGLDQQGLNLLWQVFDQWRQAGRTVVLCTHELALIERRADRVHVLVEGGLRASGTPQELRERSGLPVQTRLGPGLDEIYETIIGVDIRCGLVAR